MRWVLVCYPSVAEYREVTRVSRCVWMDKREEDGKVVWIRGCKVPVALSALDSPVYLKRLYDDDEVFLLINENGTPKITGNDISMKFKSLSTGEIVSQDSSKVRIRCEARVYARRKSTGRFRGLDGLEV